VEQAFADQDPAGHRNQPGRQERPEFGATVRIEQQRHGRADGDNGHHNLEYAFDRDSTLVVDESDHGEDEQRESIGRKDRPPAG
jgi:hypothetical protein